MLENINRLSNNAYILMKDATQAQKDSLAIQSDSERATIDSVTEGTGIKVCFSSLYHFWFSLDASLRGTKENTLINDDSFDKTEAIKTSSAKCNIQQVGQYVCDFFTFPFIFFLYTPAISSKTKRALSYMRNSVLLNVLFLLFYTYTEASLVLSKSDFDFYEKDPDKYTLFCLDTSRVLDGTDGEWGKHSKSFETVGVYLNGNLLKEPDQLSFKTQKDPPKDKTKWIRKKDNKISGEIYCIVELLVKSPKKAIDIFMDRVTTTVSLGEGSFVRLASLIIFPEAKTTKAMVYGFGQWSSLLNLRAVIPSWGLELAASKALCNPSKVRVIKATNYTKATPSTREDRSTELDTIESFDFQVGAEGIEKLRVLPKRATGLGKVVTAVDYFKFEVTPAAEGETSTIESLRKLAHSFYVYTTGKSFSLHPRLVPFLDREVNDCDLTSKLNVELVKVMQSDDVHHLVFLHNSVFTSYGTRIIFGGNKRRNKSIWPVLKEKTKLKEFSLKTSIQLRKGVRSTTLFEEQVGHLVFSLPIMYDESFYRYERGRWFEVDASRFGRIIGLLRRTKKQAAALSLPLYTYDDALKKAGDATGYAESNYNRRVVRELSSKGASVSLLDRLNVSLGGNSNLFEFSDILLEQDGKYYIIHVKRAKASALSHHREQLERTADYWSSELSRPGSEDFLLKAAIGDLYRLHKVPLTKKGDQGKRITRGNFYKKTSNSSKQPKLKSVLDIKKERPKIGKKKQHDYDLRKLIGESKEVDLEFFERKSEVFYIALNALFDCADEGALDLSGDSSLQTIEEFFERVKNAVKFQHILFPKGHLTKDRRKNIVLVLAVIDDRQVQKYKEDKKKIKEEIDKEKAKKKKNEAKIKELEQKHKAFDDKVDRADNIKRDKINPLFHKQDLWGLDRTRGLVQSKGFGFEIIVINEQTEEDWDAFGSVEKKKAVVVEDSDEEAGSATKAKGRAKGKKKDSSKREISPPPSSLKSSDSEDEELPKVQNGLYVVPLRAYKEPQGVGKTFDVGPVFLDQLNTSGENNNCAFFSIGYSRLEAANLLLGHKTEDMVRQYVGAQIHAAYLREDNQQLPKSILDNKELRDHYQDFLKWEESLKTIGGPIRESMGTADYPNYDAVYEALGDSAAEKAFQYIYETHRRKKETFRTLFDRLDIFQRFVRDYVALSGNAMEFQYTAEGGIPTVLDALAHIGRFQLVVYMEKAAGTLEIKHQRNPDLAGDIRRIHYNPSSMHFSKLQERAKT